MREGTPEVPHPIRAAHLPGAAAVFDAAPALDMALDLLDPQPTRVELLVRHVLLPRALLPQIEINSNEDRSRIRKEHAAENMAAVRHVALNLLRQEHSHQISLRQKRLLCGLDDNYLLRVLSRAT